jgi:uncharacterized protein (DUF849 family)
MSKIIISCAITGSIHTPSMSPHLPVTGAEIAAQAIGAAKAGATILHLHARNPDTGRPSADPAHWAGFLPQIKAGCDAVVNIPARDVQSEHGHDEFRAVPDGGADHRVEA